VAPVLGNILNNVCYPHLHGVISQRIGMVKNVEPPLRPDFAKEVERAAKNGKFVKVRDFAEEYGLK